MADFNKALEKVLDWEGRGYYNVPGDPGGDTAYGITFKTFKHYYADATLDDLKNITIGQVRIIYNDLFWRRIHGEGITNQSFAEFFFDTAVNVGVSRAIKALQRVLGVDVDGIVGRLTLGAINGSNDPKRVFSHFWTWRSEYYKKLVVKNPALKKFAKGWQNRCNAYHYIDEKSTGQV